VYVGLIGGIAMGGARRAVSVDVSLVMVLLGAAVVVGLVSWRFDPHRYIWMALAYGALAVNWIVFGIGLGTGLASFLILTLVVACWEWSSRGRAVND
jgi:hypothetical protein